MLLDIKIKKCQIIILLLFSPVIIQSVYLNYDAHNQNVFNQRLTTILNYPNKSAVTQLRLNSDTSNVTDHSKLEHIKYLTNLTYLYLRCRQHKPTNVEVYRAFLTPLTKLQKVYLINDYMKVSDLTPIGDGLNGKNDLIFLHINFNFNDNIVSVDPIVSIIPSMVLMENLYLYFYQNSISVTTQWSNAFITLTELKWLEINLGKNLLTSVLDFKDSFHTLDKCTDLIFNVAENDIQDWTIAQCFLQMNKLSRLDLYIEDTLDDTVYKNVFQHAPNLQTMTLRIKKAKSIGNFNDMMQDLLNLRTLNYQFYQNYDLVGFDNFYGVFNNVSALTTLNFFFYDNDLLEDLRAMTQMLSPLVSVTTLTFRFQYNELLAYMFEKLHVPSVINLRIQFDYQYQPQWKMIQFKNCFETLENMEKFEYQHYRSQLESNMDVFEGFDNLYYSLYNLSSLKYFNINFWQNKLDNVNFLSNSYDQIPFTGRIHLELQNNQLDSIDGISPFFSTAFNPEYLQEVDLNCSYNKIVDLSQLSTAFNLHGVMTQLYLNFQYNKITELSNTLGLYENKDLLTRISFYTRGNNLTDQRQFIPVLDPIYYYGKAKLAYQSFNFPHDSYNGQTYNDSGQGYYITQQKNGYCRSDYTRAYNYRTVGTGHACDACVNSFCHSCQNTTQCERCRYSGEIQRILAENCVCPETTYGGANYICIPCLIGCQTCVNGNACVTCKVSIPSRIMNQCLCPDQWFDNNVDDQCQRCMFGCAKCNNENTCSECKVSIYPQRFPLEEDCVCPDGYFDDGDISQCQRCKKGCLLCKFANSCEEHCNGRCLSCIGSDIICEACAYGQGRTMQMPDCLCKPGYYEKDPLNKDCQKCAPECITCENDFACLECNNPQMLPPYCISNNRAYFAIQELDDRHVIKQCNVMCKYCYGSADYCQECNGTLRDNLSLPECNCKAGYHDNGKKSENCEKCPETCLKCDSREKCTECDTLMNRQISLFSGQCECKPGYTQSITNKLQCIECYKYKTNCYAMCPESTYQNEELKECQNISNDPKQSGLFIWIVWIVIFIVQISVMGTAYLCIRKRFENKWKQQIIKNMQNPQDLDSSDEEELQKEIEKQQFELDHANGLVLNKVEAIKA